jgi:hypothetical protein
MHPYTCKTCKQATANFLSTTAPCVGGGGGPGAPIIVFAMTTEVRSVCVYELGIGGVVSMAICHTRQQKAHMRLCSNRLGCILLKEQLFLSYVICKHAVPLDETNFRPHTKIEYSENQDKQTTQIL